MKTKQSVNVLFYVVLILATIASAQLARAADKVLILGDTVINGTSSLEAQAAAGLGFQVDVENGSWWTDPSRTAADFSGYRAIILGDPDCTGDPTPMQAAELTTNLWGPLVNGNVIVIGTDPVYHAINGGGGAPPGALALIQKGIAFATSQPGKTGFYISLSCDYATASPSTPVPVLQPFGTFTLEMAPDCYNKSHIVASDPSLTGLSDYLLSGWSCSVHEVFDSWPTNFQVFAIARDLGSVYHAPDGTVGTPYILARGVAPITNGCGSVSVGNAQISSSTFSFSALGPNNTLWNVYSSIDLTNWALAGGMTLDSSGNGSFTDTTITGVAHRFYRVSDGDCCSQPIGFGRIYVGSGPTNDPGTNALIANQFDAPENTLDGLFNVNGSGAMPDGTALADGSEIEKWDVSFQAFVYYTWSAATGWLDGSGNPAGMVSLNPGEAAFLATSNATTVTFIGLVRQGTLTTSLGPANYYLLSAQVPAAGGLTTGLNYVPHGGDQVLLWNGTSYNLYQYLNIGSPHWNPTEPILNVGQGFFWRSGTNNAWQINLAPCSGQVACTPPTLTNAVIASGTSFSFNGEGAEGSYWNVYESSDLTNWAFVGGMTLDGSGNGSFADNSINGVQQRFYKLSNGDCCSQAIGFYLINVGPGSTNSPGTNALIANQLDSFYGNTLDGLFNVNGGGTMPDGTSLMDGSTIIKWNVPLQLFQYYTWTLANGWRDASGNPAGTVTMNPGEGVFLATSNAVTVTFVGSVHEGTTTISINATNEAIISAPLPKAGGLTTGLGFTPSGGDQVFLWNGSGYNLYQYIRIGSPHWNPSEPVLNVGQAFFLRSATNKTWQMSFTACSGQTLCSSVTLTNSQIYSDTFFFNSFGPEGSYWNVFESSDLTNWFLEGGVTLDSSGSGSFTDPTITGIAHRFYRFNNGDCCSQPIGFVRLHIGVAASTNNPGTNALIANQLDSFYGNTLDGLFNVNGGGTMPDGTALPDGSIIQKWDVPTQAYVSYTWSSATGWEDAIGNPAGSVTLAPGEGAFLYNFGGDVLPVTFVGLVEQGTLSTSLTSLEYQLISAKLPKSGGLQTSLSYNPQRGDRIEVWNGTTFNIYQNNGSLWLPSEPVINVGQSFFWYNSATNNNTWQMNFSGCQ